MLAKLRILARLRIPVAVAAVVGAFVVATPTPASAVVGQSLFGNQHTGKCLEMPFSRTHSSASAGQYTCHGGRNQQWRYNTATGLIMNINSGKCLEVLGWSRANGAAVGQFDCHGGNNQKWYLNRTNGLIGNTFSGKCLEVYAWSTADFASVVQWECHGGANQVWRWR